MSPLGYISRYMCAHDLGCFLWWLSVTCRTGAYPGFSEGGGVPRSAKQANKPNKRATELKPRPCAHRGQCLSPTSVCCVESSIFTTLV